MDRRCIVVCDSGIGGLRMLKKLEQRFPCENFVYFADYVNLPYGDKNKQELLEIAEENYKKATAFSPKLIVFACNTLSTNVLPSFKQKPIPIIGVFPEVKNGKGLLLCTEGTAKSQYVKNLQKCYDNLSVVPLKNLATQIEDFVRYGTEIDLNEIAKVSIDGYEYLSLGCTHYPYAENYLRKIFKNIPFISGEKRTFEKIEFFMTTFDTGCSAGSVSFVGKDSEFLKTLYNKGILNI